jgi:hypothetical protein
MTVKFSTPKMLLGLIVYSLEWAMFFQLGVSFRGTKGEIILIFVFLSCE